MRNRHHPRPALLLLALTAVVLLPRPCGAQIFEATGERALGMGGAFVAVADDGTATYWNPAGLATGASFDTCLARSRDDVRSDGGPPGALAAAGTATSFCLAVPALGFSYNTLRGVAGGRPIAPTEPVPAGRQDLRPRVVEVSSLTTRQAGVTLVQSLVPGVALGATLKYVRGTAAVFQAPAASGASDLLDRAFDLGGRASGTFDADIGAMVSAGPLRAGVTVRNVRAPAFEADDGSALRLARQVRVGVAVAPGGDAVQHTTGDGWILALDADLTRTPAVPGDRRMVALGVERWLASHRVGLRGGARANTVGSARPAATGGLSIAVKTGVFVEAHVARGGQDADRGWGVGLRAGF